MKKDDKDLLLRDLSARLPYGVYVVDVDENDNIISTAYSLYDIDIRFPFPKDCSRIKPYLRPLSSMTEKEQKEFVKFHCVNICPIVITESLTIENESKMIDWLNKHHFDYRGLIKKELILGKYVKIKKIYLNIMNMIVQHISISGLLKLK